MENGVYSEKYRIMATDVDSRDKWKLQSLLAVCQEAANDQCEELGAGRNFLSDKSNAAFILARNRVEMIRYPKSCERVDVSTWPKHGTRHVLTRFFEVRDAGNMSVAKIISHWAVMDLKERKLVSPENAGVVMPDTSTVADLGEMPAKIRYDGEFYLEKDVTASYSDIDVLQHVNNTRYVSWICDGLGFVFFENRDIEILDIRYSHEVTPGTVVTLKYGRISENELFVRGDSKEGNPFFDAYLKIRENLL